MQVLIADDDAVTRRIVGTLLGRMGHQVLEAADGATAWALVQEHHPDVVIADWEMPAIRGLDLVHRVRNLDGPEAYTYFILLTSHDDRAAIAASSSAGVDDHLAKPLDHHQLSRRMAVADRLTTLQKRLAATNQRMREALRAAQRTQLALIPARPPELPGMACAWRLRSCDELAGDLLGAFRLDERHLSFHVLDISGHGVSAALLAVQVARYLDPTAGTGSVLRDGDGPADPQRVPRALNDIFRRDGALQFMTLVYGVLDLETFRVRLACSAHPSPVLLRRDGRIEEVEVASQPLAMLPTARLEVTTWEFMLEPGDRLLLFSDGATEAAGPGGEFGRERLAGALAAQPATEAGAMLDGILSAITAWTGGPFQDDVSLLLLHRPA